MSEEDSKGFMQRNLQDTQYIASFMLNYIRSHLAFADFPAAGKKRVVAVNGAVTAFLRKRWGLGKVRADAEPAPRRRCGGHCLHDGWNDPTGVAVLHAYRNLGHPGRALPGAVAAIPG